ncbi:MAG: hypothetical protein OEW44_09270 [Gemmatimonadota bacterium]|jgi:hypothetical protein|nr:hypothetical protein [Gemmatimonadota bacterium]
MPLHLVLDDGEAEPGATGLPESTRGRIGIAIAHRTPKTMMSWFKRYPAILKHTRHPA